MRLAPMRKLLLIVLCLSAYAQDSKINQQHNARPHQQKSDQEADPAAPNYFVETNVYNESPCTGDTAKETGEHGDQAHSKGIFGWINFTAIAALFTAVAAIAVSLQVMALYSSERAWLTVSPIDIPQNMQKTQRSFVRFGFGFDWEIKNCGKTPAFITKVGARFYPIKDVSELPPEPNIDVPDLSQPTDIFPHGLSIGPGESYWRYTISKKGQPASTADYQEIFDRKVTWIAYGVVEYRTVFRKRKIRRTHFCYKWTPGSEQSFLRSPLPKAYTKQT